MSSVELDDRRRALEEQFFQKHDQELVAKLKAEAAKKHSHDELKHLTGITNEQVLDALSALQLGGAATLVMSMFPIVEVAWADGKPDAKELKIIRELARTIGLVPGSPAASYLDKWLEEKPEPSWHTLWVDYVRALCAHMKSDDRAMLKATVLGRARVVAEASGGFLGVAFRVSAAEQKALDGLEAAFA